MEEKKTNSLLIIGHRGAPKEAPENTMSSFERAIKTGAGAVEADLRRSADGRVVVIHDKTVNRTTGATGRVDSFSEDRLLGLNAGAGFGKKFASEKIPSLDDLLSWASEKKVKLFLELKDSEIEEFVIRRIASFDMIPNVAIVSLNLLSLAKIRDLEPGISVAPILVSANKLSRRATELKPDWVFLWAGPLMTSGVISTLNAMNISVAAWIVDSKPLLSKILKRGANAVVTNEPSIISGYIKNHENQ